MRAISCDFRETRAGWDELAAGLPGHPCLTSPTLPARLSDLHELSFCPVK